MRTPFLLVLLAAGCAPSASAPEGPPAGGLETQADYEAELARLSAQIDTAIGDAQAGDRAQCRILEVGVKPCGGPWEYRVFSSESGDPARVLELTAAYNARNAEMNERFGLASTCEYRSPPDVVLEGGRCMARNP